MDIHRIILTQLDAGIPFAVIVVLRAAGSTPVKAGAKAVVDADGRIQGSIGGGSVEAEAQDRAMEACACGRSLVFDYQLSGRNREDETPICGGAMRILVDSVKTGDRDTYHALAQDLDRRQGGLLVTRIPTQGGTSVQWRSASDLAGHQVWPGARLLRQCLADETPRLFTRPDEKHAVFAEPVVPRPRLVIAGGGHVGRALARQAAAVDFEVVVVDDRPAFCQPDRYPASVEVRQGAIPQCTGEAASPHDYVVIVTRNHQLDAETLAVCLRQSTSYLGMIGSRRKIALLRESFVGAGLTTAEIFDRVHAPIGLDIGACTASEIAASIVAQLILVRRKGPRS